MLILIAWMKESWRNLLRAWDRPSKVARMQTPWMRLRIDPWLNEHAKGGRTSVRARAAYVHMDHSAVGRIEKGEVKPGGQFIASTKLAFPRRTVEFFFEAVGDLEA
jgi:hypothetical protein